MAWLASFLESYPELAVFLAVGLGYVLGDIKVAGITPRAGHRVTSGGNCHRPVRGSACFGNGKVLSVPAVSFRDRILSRASVPAVHAARWAAVTATGDRLHYDGPCNRLVVSRFLGLDPGYSAGLLSGGLTQSAAMGTATEAVNRLAIPAEQRQLYVAHIAVADAVCYVFGIVGAIWFCSVGAPKLLGADLVADAKEIEAEFGLEEKKHAVLSGYHVFELRAFRLPPKARSCRSHCRRGRASSC